MDALQNLYSQVQQPQQQWNATGTLSGGTPYNRQQEQWFSPQPQQRSTTPPPGFQRQMSPPESFQRQRSVAPPGFVQRQRSMTPPEFVLPQRSLTPPGFIQPRSMTPPPSFRPQEAIFQQQPRAAPCFFQQQSQGNFFQQQRPENFFHQQRPRNFFQPQRPTSPQYLQQQFFQQQTYPQQQQFPFQQEPEYNQQPKPAAPVPPAQPYNPRPQGGGPSRPPATRVTVVPEPSAIASTSSTRERTLTEPVSATLARDVKRVANNLQQIIVFNSSRNDPARTLRDWDLWGPFFFIIAMSCILSSTATSDKSTVFAVVFAVLSAGAVSLTMNVVLLGGKLNFLQSLSVLGYCLFPLDVGAVLCAAYRGKLYRSCMVLITFLWSSWSVYPFVATAVRPSRKALAVYPVFLMYISMGFLVLAND